MRSAAFGFLLLWAIFCGPRPAPADDVGEALNAVVAVGPRGEGHEAATAAVRQLEQADATALTRILAAMDGANPLAVNWLRGAFESVADRELSKSQSLPVDQLEAFLTDTTHNPRARRLAYEWIIKAEPDAADRIIPGMLNDPSAEMRRDAVARLIAQGEQQQAAGETQAALRTFESAMSGAVDGDQVQGLAQSLAALGRPVDLVQHFGLLTEWNVIGPFDNRGGIGFAAVYPPEEELDFDAEYDGQLGKVKWESIASTTPEGTSNVDEVGKVDLARLTAPHKGAVTYTATEFVAAEAGPVEFRIGTPNAWKLWVNGELVFGQEEYHRGMFFDQYIVRANLKQGENTFLLKVCQNEQTEDWAQVWAFQLRVCDLTGRGLNSAEERTAARVE
jgi:hypothetical protein